jgi:DNA-binding NarL/FixJ family response regulator
MAEPLKNFHFLIAGTDPVHLEAMDEMLFAAGAAMVTRAASGREAVASWRSATRTVDCVISECRMAEGNGLQLLFALRTGRILNARPDTCFIPFADSADPKIISVCAQLDVNGFLVKPINEERLLGTIAKARKRNIRIDYDLYNRVSVPEAL